MCEGEGAEDRDRETKRERMMDREIGRQCV